MAWIDKTTHTSGPPGELSELRHYQATAARYGTMIERASRGIPSNVGGGITRHPLAPAVAAALTPALRALGAETKIYDPRNDDRVFVYLAGCSFQKGDLP